MKTHWRIVIALIIVCGVVTWSACSSDGYGGTSTVYVSHGYGGYGPGWGYGWAGYGGGFVPPPVIIGPPVGGPVPMPF